MCSVFFYLHDGAPVIIKKESPNEGTEIGNFHSSSPPFSIIKKESPNEGTEIFSVSEYITSLNPIKKESPNEGTEMDEIFIIPHCLFQK